MIGVNKLANEMQTSFLCMIKEKILHGRNWCSVEHLIELSQQLHRPNEPKETKSGATMLSLFKRDKKLKRGAKELEDGVLSAYVGSDVDHGHTVVCVSSGF